MYELEEKGPCMSVDMKNDFTPGVKIHNVTAQQLTKTLRLRLPALGSPEAALMTLEVFRAGRATELWRQGKTLRVILLSGEWKSAAYLAHCNPDEVDAAAFLTVQIENSDTEE